MNWFNIIKRRVMGRRFSLDGQIYHFGPKEIEFYEKKLQELKNVYPADAQKRKEMALRETVQSMNLEKNDYNDSLLRESGAVTTATPAIINIRYSKKKKKEDD
jgi:hypothetical protein